MSVSKESWKGIVKHNVTQVALAQLSVDIKDKPKTKHLSYHEFASQPYMHQSGHKQSSIIFKLRSFSIDCKANRKSSNSDITCRLCKTADETQDHVINCPAVRGDGGLLDLSRILNADFDSDDVEVSEICDRVNEFNKLVNDGE